MIRTRFYARVSTVDQVSTRAQLDDLRKTVSHDDRVIQKEIEEKKSAKEKANIFDVYEYMKKRPEFYNECYLPSTRKMYDELYVWKWDRFARSDFAAIMVRLFDYHGVKVIALRDSNEPLVRDIQGVLGKEEIRKIKERVELRQQELIADNKVITRMPFGYKPIKKLIDDEVKVVRWDIDEKEAVIVRQMYAMNNDHTVQEIADKFKMPYSTVKSILHNRVYFGFVKFRKQEYQSKDFEPILKPLN